MKTYCLLVILLFCSFAFVKAQQSQTSGGPEVNNNRVKPEIRTSPEANDFWGEKKTTSPNTNTQQVDKAFWSNGTNAGSQPDAYYMKGVKSGVNKDNFWSNKPQPKMNPPIITMNGKCTWVDGQQFLQIDIIDNGSHLRFTNISSVPVTYQYKNGNCVAGLNEDLAPGKSSTVLACGPNTICYAMPSSNFIFGKCPLPIDKPKPKPKEERNMSDYIKVTTEY